MAKIGLRDLFAMPIESETAEATTYGEAFRVAKAITLGLTPNVSEAQLYADDGLDESVSSLMGYDLSLNVNNLLPDVESKLLGKKLDAKGGIVTTGDDIAPAFALAWRAQQSDGKFEYRVIYKVKFAPSDENYQTKGDSVEFQTPTITGKVSQRADGKIDYKIVEGAENADVIGGWFTAPAEPAVDAPAG